jgi:hypothetical protein
MYVYQLDTDDVPVILSEDGLYCPVDFLSVFDPYNLWED